MTEIDPDARTEGLTALIKPVLPNHCCAPDEANDCPYDAHDARGIAEVIAKAGWVSPEDHHAEVRQAAMGGRIAAAANYPGIVTELLGYLGAAIDDGQTLDPSEMHNYVRDLKHRYVTEPVIAALAEETS